MKIRFWRVFVLCLVIFAVLSGCATSPTGRSQFILMPNAQMSQMGIQSFEQMKKQTPIENDPAWNEYVKCIAIPLTQVAEQEGSTYAKSWEVVVFKDPTANAFALPGGKIGVHTGIMKVAKTDAQLAAVIGHEIGHVIARHGNERVSQGLAAQGGLMAAQAYISGSASPEVGKLVMAGLGLGTQFGVLLPFGRTQESEADVIGLRLMATAGFDPRDSIELWRNMESEGGGKQPPEWMSTHPSHGSRMKNLADQMPAPYAAYKHAQEQGRNPKCKRP